MLRIDKEILITDKVICDNIDEFYDKDRGFLSQNILSQLRNFVEYIALKEYFKNDEDPNDYNLRTKALNEMRRHGNLKFLSDFHALLQKSVSHYTVDKDGAERLMLKYYEYLLKIKLYLKHAYNMDVLENINKFPLDTDKELSEYYEKIAEKIENNSSSEQLFSYKDRYYIQKVKPFFVNGNIYYEISFSIANANASKFDRLIAFTNKEIVDNYSVRLRMHKENINVVNQKMTILIIDDYDVSIRPCELRNMLKIFGVKEKISTNSVEYQNLMTFLKDVKMSLTDYVSEDQRFYDYIKTLVTNQAQKIKIFNLLDSCRNIVKSNKPGTNVIRYLLYRMNNRIIKLQYNDEVCSKLSDLKLSYKCIPFDSMPYCSSLRQHNPKISDLYASISVTDREHELFARFIKNNTEIENILFTPQKSIESSGNIDDLINTYNNSLYYKHSNRMIMKYKNNLYIKEYVDDCEVIIRKLQELSSSGINHYSSSFDSWIKNNDYYIDDSNKKEILSKIFSNSKVALIYGSAGTGKTTLIKHISNFWANKKKVFLANTHPAVDNMRRKINIINSEFSTIAKFISKKSKNNCDVLFIDECSTVSNHDMRSIIENTNFKLLVLVGDTHQIESIYFGNWFSIAKKFVPNTSIFNLNIPYRTTSENLKLVWKRVRDLDDDLLESLVKSGYVSRFDETIFKKEYDDEMILCLNYDGLYGINNINRYLQNNNPASPVIWGMNTYKVNDPILFNESRIFSPLIHNNSKGKIVGIDINELQIKFKIELDESINEMDAENYAFELLGESESGKSIISFAINKMNDSDEDDVDDDLTIVPFQVAYAVSIHKAQGLEYDSVKIIISNEIEEQITHNIFYTAITRAKKKLKIYWSPETEKSVIARFKKKDINKDAHLLSQIKNLTLNNK